MLKKEDLKVGLLIWWSAERYMRGWSCPAIVTEASDKSFKVRSLDDFKETDDLRMEDDPEGLPYKDESSRKEMRICTMDEVKEYFKKSMRVMEDKVTENQRALTDAQSNLTEYQERVKDFLL